jgi:hypothetical protein
MRMAARAQADVMRFNVLAAGSWPGLELLSWSVSLLS